MERKGIHTNFLHIVSFTTRVSHIRRAIESIIKASNVETEDLVDRIMEQLCRTRIGEYCYNQIGMGCGEGMMDSTIISRARNSFDFKS